ncbi:uncharacterized protein BDZ99DRAFT_489662 [Mytilinidion resinicola]|uniref:Uncharacterized protein n=1 Tax=Mytilinidion resinicola TaxID=574789 RepID=A0A6A6YF54_9PEZI|nr:uncharacterized protein BDZ99DRAFT_489662 [Mytilinidion resinicola]KAF2807208.1 hypothetical protein BDZ99DRAFT_489662 [Mytilinidion resinicola]
MWPFSWIHAALNWVMVWMHPIPHHQVGWKSLSCKLKLLLLFNPFTEWINTTHAMRMYIHRKNARQAFGSRKYPTSADFFIRKHNPGTRPIAENGNPKKAFCVADSRVVCYDTVGESKQLWIKGTDFSITNLVMDVNLGARFNDAAVASFRLFSAGLSPLPLSCEWYCDGVELVVLRSDVNILTTNARDYVLVDLPEFGEGLFCAIGATDVGTV